MFRGDITWVKFFRAGQGNSTVVQLIENKNKLLLSLNLSHALMFDKLIFQTAFNSNYVIFRYICLVTFYQSLRRPWLK